MSVFAREAIKTRTAKTVFAFHEKAQRDRQFAKRFLISLDRREPRDQIAFAVRGAARVQLAVLNRRRERTGAPLSQVAHGLHVVMAVDHESLWSTATLAVNDRIARADLERAGAHPDALHHLFDGFGDGAHAGAARGDGWHTAKTLQPLREIPRVTVHITIELGETHACLYVFICGSNNR